MMEAGRELDARVAEKVMGLDGVGYYKRESCRTSLWIPAVEGETTDDHPAWTASLYYLPGASEYGKPAALALSARLSPFALPRYSTDIAAAWQVVEKDDGWGSDWKLKRWVASSKPWSCTAERTTDGQVFYAEAETAPHAICLAALKAVAR